MDLLKSFIIGSSAPVTIPILLKVSRMNKDKWNWNYIDYSMSMPIGFGGAAVVATILRNKFNISILISTLIVFLISLLIGYAVIRGIPMYNFTQKEWEAYTPRFLSLYIISFTTIFLLEYMLNSKE
jgi:ABC-type uncharacterized transport system permease subunit